MTDRIHAPSGTQERVETYTTRAGHASAMCISMCMVGNDEKALAWEAEERAWTARAYRIIDSVPYGGFELSMLAMNTHGIIARQNDPRSMVIDVSLYQE